MSTLFGPKKTGLHLAGLPRILNGSMHASKQGHISRAFINVPQLSFPVKQSPRSMFDRSLTSGSQVRVLLDSPRFRYYDGGISAAVRTVTLTVLRRRQSGRSAACSQSALARTRTGHRGPARGKRSHRNTPEGVKANVCAIRQIPDQEGRKDYILRVYPNGSHNLMEVPPDNTDEYFRLKRFPPGFFEMMVDGTTTQLRRRAPARR